MGDSLNLTDEERDRSARKIENFLEFTRDVLNDPSILDHIPNGSTVKAIPIAERDPNVRYDIETPRYLAIVTPGGMDTPPSAKQADDHPRRIERDVATRLKRIRAAHR
jgi:hypothetical protein